MRKLLVALCGLFICLSAGAQSGSGTITASGADCTTVTACAAAKLAISDPGSATIQITGTWSMTLQFEASSDGGTTWVAVSVTPLGSSTAVTSATANGTWRMNAASITDIRVRASAFVSGTAVVLFRSSKAVANAGGGGGTSLPDITDVPGVSVTIGNSAVFLAQTGSGTAPGIAFSGQATTGLVASGGNLYLVTPAAAVNFNNGTNVNAAVNTSTGLFTTYGTSATAGYGVPAIRGVTSQKAETTTADANVLTYTPPAAVGTYRVSVNISVSSATAGVIAWTLSWTDSNGNAQSNIAMPLFQLATAAPNTTFTTSVAGNYTGTSTIDVNNAAAAIVVKWVGGGVTAAKMSAVIERVQ